MYFITVYEKYILLKFMIVAMKHNLGNKEKERQFIFTGLWMDD